MSTSLQDSTKGRSLSLTSRGQEGFLSQVSVSQIKKRNPAVSAIAYLTYGLKFGILFVSMYWLISKKRSLDVTGNS